MLKNKIKGDIIYNILPPFVLHSKIVLSNNSTHGKPIVTVVAVQIDIP